MSATRWNKNNIPYLPQSVWAEARALTKFRLSNIAPSVPVDYWERMLDNWDDEIVANALIEIGVELAQAYKLPVVSMQTWVRCSYIAGFKAAQIRHSEALKYVPI